MLRQALPGYEGQLRPQMLDEPKGIPTPEAEFPYRFGPDPLHSRPGLFPGEQAEPVQGRQVLMSKTPSPTGARTEVCYNQDWNGTACQTVGRQTYIWDDADNIVEYLWEAWDSWGFRWENSWRSTYAYDAAGNQTLYQYVEWNPSTGEKTWGWRYTSTYDASGNWTGSPCRRTGTGPPAPG